MLNGVRVIDFSRVVAGPYCGRVLADMGADVIKVEPPEGDSMTRRGAPLVDGVSSYFAQFNSGKRSISVDLTRPEGQAAVEALLVDADVLLQNFRPGVLERWGFGPDQVAERHPRIVYCSINGYGSDGPWRDRRAYAPVVHGEAGLIASDARLFDKAPAPVAFSFADVYAGSMASTAVCGALFERERTGKGQHLDVALADVTLYNSEFCGPELAGQVGPALYAGAASVAVVTADGGSALTQGNPVHTFPQWARAFGRAELLEEERFRSVRGRLGCRDELISLILGWVAGLADFDELERTVGPQRLAVGQVRSIPEIAETEWAVERRVFAEVAPGVRVARAPFRSSAHPNLGAAGPPPEMGEHNREVLAAAGQDVDALESTGVIYTEPLPGRTA